MCARPGEPETPESDVKLMGVQLRVTVQFALVALIAIGSGPRVAAASVEVRRTGDHIDILVGGHPFTTYYFGSAAAKPYLYPLRSAQGTVVTRNFPMTSDTPGERP